MDSINDQKENKQNKKKNLLEIEDIISIGALLRPTLVSAISHLKEGQLEELKEVLISAEKELARSDVDLKKRFSNVKTILEKTYKFDAIWRFITTRIEETWTTARDLTVKELSVVSLLLGMLIEETQNKLKNKKRKSA